MTNKKIKNILGYVAIWTMVVNQLWLPLAVWAQEADVSPTPTEEISPTSEPDEITPTPTEEISPTPTADPLPTETLEPTPTEKVSPTPTETVEPTPTTEVEALMASPTATPTASLSTESAQLATIGEIILVIPKSVLTGTVEDGNVDDDTEDRQAEEETAVIETGSATAVANVINMVNTNIDSGTIGIYIVDQLDNGDGETKTDLNLNDIWKLSNSSGQTEFGVDNANSMGWLNVWLGQTSINNDVNVAANSGLNLIGESNDAYIISGDATALVNILNIVNANFFNSQIFFGIVNIDGASLGNIILPRPDLFLENGVEDKEGNANTGLTSNIVEINNTSVAIANSGGNETVGQEESVIITGDSLSATNNMTMVNIGGGGNDMFYFNLMTTGQTSGQIFNWLSPGEAMSMSAFVNVFGLGLGGNADGNILSLFGLNSVNINNNVTAVANSGLNQIWGDGSAQIVTGNASSIVNLSNFVNLNLKNNRWFYGLVNIVGNWSGNIIFAYPDLSISLGGPGQPVANGESLVFEVNYFNNGYEESQDTIIELNLPSEFDYITDNSGFDINKQGKKLSWMIDGVKEGQGGSFEVTVGVEVKQSILAGLIKKVWAADEIEVSTESMISTSQPESDTNNNFALVKTSIVMFENTRRETGEISDNSDYQNEGDGIDHRQPIISINSNNNVAEFVYTGDIVTFEVDVTNESDVTAFDSVLVCDIYDDSGELIRNDEINIGEIGAYKSGKINFGLPVSSDMSSGQFESVMMIFARAKDGGEVESNVSTTEFNVRSRQLQVGMDNGQVLAQTDFSDENVIGNIAKSVNLLPYILLFVVSAGWIYKQTKVWSCGTKTKLKLSELAWFALVVLTFVYSLVAIINKN